MGRRKKGHVGQFVMLTVQLLKDPEWRKLSSSAKIVWIYMRVKFNYKTFSEVTLTYSELKDLMSSATTSRAFKELIKAGFIEKIRPGGLYGGATVYSFVGPHKDFYHKGRRI